MPSNWKIVYQPDEDEKCRTKYTCTNSKLTTLAAEEPDGASWDGVRSQQFVYTSGELTQVKLPEFAAPTSNAEAKNRTRPHGSDQ